MTATVEPRATTPEAPANHALARADGLELLGEVPGSGYREGAALVRRADGQMVQLGPLQYALLEACDGRCEPARLAHAMTERLGRVVEQEHVAKLAQKLAEQGLLLGTESNAPPRLNPLLALRWKVLVTNPKVTRRLTQPFLGLFRPWIVVAVLAAFVAVFWFVLIHKGVASATAQAFQKPELLLLVFVLGVASAAFHEIGHASACRYSGATPGGMGMGIYMVWPAFYTDVTDAYRLPKRDRLRVDLGGLYFNAVVAVATLAVWLSLRVDALLLLVALQLLQMVKQLSPVIRADGYHILSDASGVPDLYAHIVPTLKRLLPGHRDEPSALTGRARLLVTLWVLVIVPVLLSLSISAVVLLPHLAATTWVSAHRIASTIPGDASHGHVFDGLAAIVRLAALALPVLGSVLVAQRIVRRTAGAARRWSGGRPVRRTSLALAGCLVVCGLAWAWWPSGQYQPVRGDEGGTIQGIGQLVASPAGAARPPAPVAAVKLTPGKHLAVAMIPAGGATKQHPAFFMIRGGKGQNPVMLVSERAPDPGPVGSGSGTAADPAAGPTPAGSAPVQPAASAPSATTTSTPVAAFPFKLPAAPGPHGTQALAVNTKDGGVKYDVVYALVTVDNGAKVDESNAAYALANCNACTTVAVSVQVVLVIGQSNVIVPVNLAEALNVNCPACVTTAIADQIVVTLKAPPTQQLLDTLNGDLQQLNAIPQLGSGGSPDAVAKEVAAIQDEVESELTGSGLMTNPPAGSSTGTSTTTTTATSTTPTQTSTSTTTSTGTGTTDTSTTPTTTDTSSTGTTTAGTQTTTSTTPTSTDTGTSTTPTTTTDTGTSTSTSP